VASAVVARRADNDQIPRQPGEVCILKSQMKGNGRARKPANLRVDGSHSRRLAMDGYRK
jgi:hypothetical protein